MKNGFIIIFFLFAVVFHTAAFSSKFNVCESKYALCTTALCTSNAGKNGLASCHCDVKTGYSAGTKPCQAMKNTSKGQLIYSRYYPIKGYVPCSNSRPWAWCLDSPCLIDEKNQSQATCACSTVKNKGNYIIVTDQYSASACTTGLYSSALITDVNQINNFLKTQEKLQPYPITVYDKN